MTDNNNWQSIAHISEIEDPGSLAFQVDAEPLPVLGFIVRKDGEVFGYENVCPHAGRNLNWGPHRFLTQDQSMIICAAHGAVFEIASGECSEGPCLGESLRKVPVRLENDVIYADVSGLAIT